MKLKPLEQWICDGCGEIIDSPEHGMVEWLSRSSAIPSGPPFRVKGFRVVHVAAYSPRWPNGSCYKYEGNAGGQDNHLVYFTGEEGMARLLRFVDIGPYHEEEYKGPMAENLREWAELVRRLTIRYYEEARLYWHKALEDGFFDGANEIYIYLPDTLKRIIADYGD